MVSLSKSSDKLSSSKNLNESFPSDSDENLLLYDSSSVKQRKKNKLLRRNSSLS